MVCGVPVPGQQLLCPMEAVVDPLPEHMLCGVWSSRSWATVTVSNGGCS